MNLNFTRREGTKFKAPLNNALAFWLSQKEVDQGEHRREYRDIFKTFNTEQRLFEKPRRARLSAVFSVLRPLPIGSLFAAGLALLFMLRKIQREEHKRALNLTSYTIRLCRI